MAENKQSSKGGKGGWERPSGVKNLSSAEQDKNRAGGDGFRTGQGTGKATRVDVMAEARANKSSHGGQRG